MSAVNGVGLRACRNAAVAGGGADQELGLALDQLVDVNAEGCTRVIA